MATDKYKALLKKFNQQLRSEADCVSYVYGYLADQGLTFCRKCNSAQVERDGDRTIRCLDCGKQSWFTSGTFFHRAKKLKPLVALLWFQAHRLPLSSSRGARLLRIAQCSVWKMLKKIQRVWLSDLEQQEGTLGISCEAFFAAIKKRSRETPARVWRQAFLPLATV